MLSERSQNTKEYILMIPLYRVLKQANSSVVLKVRIVATL